MSMRFRRGAIRARDIDGEPAAVKLQVRIRGFVSVVPAVPRLKTRPRSSAVLSTAIFFAIDEPWTPRERTRCITNAARFIYPVEKFQSIVLRTRHLQRVSDFCNEYYISLILWFFFALEFISINLNSSFFFFFKLFRRNLIEWREAREWVIRGKKKRRSN